MLFGLVFQIRLTFDKLKLNTKLLILLLGSLNNKIQRCYVVAQRHTLVSW